MMATTHAAIAVAAVLPFAVQFPELAVPAALAAYAGGLFPDLDVIYLHRRALHYPAGYWLIAAPTAGVAAIWTTPFTVGVAAFLFGAALHSVTDIFGGGLGLRPWENDDQRGVFDHRRGRWIRPRRYVRYDGAPEDLLVGSVFALPALWLYGPPIRGLIAIGIAASAMYTIVRKRLPGITPERFK